MATPTDTYYGNQWHFQLMPGIEDVWDEYSGNGVVVGVYDDGVQYNHEDLNDNYDATLGVVDGSGTLVDGLNATGNDGHGTAVAGIIAAENNGIGAVGVAWGGTVGSVNIFDGWAASNLIGAIGQADNSFDLTSNSWGWSPYFQSFSNLNGYTYVSLVVAEQAANLSAGRDGLGTLFVKASGNDDLNANGEGLNAARETITVGAISWFGGNAQAASYTNFGSSILISAGAASVTTDLQGNDGYNGSLGDNDYTNGFGGTSAATPVVSGVVALMLEANEELGWRDVHSILAVSAAHVGSDVGSQAINYEDGVWIVNGASNWNGGGMTAHANYGYGTVDAYAAVRMAEVWHLFGEAQTSANEQQATFTNNNVNLSIADFANGTNGVASYAFNVTDNLVVENVQVTLTLTHPDLQDLLIKLVSADGTEIELMNFDDVDRYGAYQYSTGTAANGWTWTFGVEHLRGELSAGTWTVIVEDQSGGSIGTLDEVVLDIYGTTPTSDDVYHYTNDFLYMLGLDPSRADLSDTNGGTDWINAAAIYTGDVSDYFGNGSQIGSIEVDLATNGSGGVTIFAVDGNNNAVGSLDAINIANGTQIENYVGGDADETITGNNANNEIYGMRGNDIIDGGGGADMIDGGGGDDIIDGGSGADIAMFDVAFSDRTHVRFGNEVLSFSNSSDEKDHLRDIELLGFTDIEIDTSTISVFDPYSYLASNTDLISAYSNDLDAAFNHYFDTGYEDGRSLDNFDEWSYLAGYRDLIAAFGTDVEAATKHYVRHGFGEGRVADQFDEWSYLASYKDLLNAFGSDTEAATKHYVRHGFKEGRVNDRFDEWSYLASHEDLLADFGTDTDAATQHYVNYGYSQGREVDSFDEYLYIASYSDLILAFGTNGAAATKHYVTHGFGEGRQIDFDAEQYIANYADLQAAFGDDTSAATIHFIYHGYYEGRVDELTLT